MRQRTAILLLIAALLAVGVVGAFVYYRMGNQVAGVPPLPPGTRSFGNWALVCGQGEGEGRCSLLIRAINQDTQQIIAALNLTRGPQGNAVFAVTTPPGVLIPNGVTMTPAGGTAARGAVQVCRPQNCTGIIVLGETLLTELASAQATTVSYTSANGQTVNLNLPTNGFAEGFNAWREAYPHPAPPPAAEATPAEGEAAPAAEGEAAPAN